MRSVTNSLTSLKYPVEVSVIVCHHKGDFIYKFIDSVKKSIGVTYEIIVITSDDNIAVTGIKGCRVFNGPQLPADKRNIGARLSNGQYLAFFDDDVEINSDCLLKYKLFMDSNPSCGMAYGKLYNMEHRNRFDEAGGFLTWNGFIWSRAGQNDIDSGQYDYYSTILAGKSASCIIREEVFFKVGGFDEQFGILGEETDLSWRVWLQDFRVCFVPEAVGYHAFNTKFKPANEYYTSTRVHLNGCRNYIVMLQKNLGGKMLWRILPVHILCWIIAGCAMIVTLRVTQGLNIFRGLIQVIQRYPDTIKKRRKIQERRRVSDRELWPFIFARTHRGYYFRRFLRYLSIGLHG